ncbi:MAG: hypothetical protein NUV91_01765 [Candidatus Omnitrophica bacterium]|nr:hypothetical protein [Candidatus Omnitrophota bacterium]
MIKQRTISFYTFGCRLNQSETAVIENSFRQNGYQVSPLGKNSEIVVINTCTVTENGDADTRRLVSKVNRLNPHAKIALVGCQAQIQKDQLAQLPNVTWVVGNERKMDLADILQGNSIPKKNGCYSSDDLSKKLYGFYTLNRSTSHKGQSQNPRWM